MPISFTSQKHIFSVNDLTATFTGDMFADDPTMLDTSESVVDAFTNKDGDILYAIDSEFGFNVTDFIGADEKELDDDYGEGFAGNIIENDLVTGLAVRNAPTVVFKSGAPLGTWSLGLGGTTVKASTEHYVTMAQVLSDQAFPGDEDALSPLDDDLKMLDLRPTGPNGEFEAGLMHDAYVKELSEALQVAIDNKDNDQTYTDAIDFNRDGVLDTYSTVGTLVQTDTDGDGDVEEYLVGGLDLDNDGTADVVDSFLNGYDADADIVDLLEPNESSVTYDIAYGDDYSVTLKDDGKLLYRWGEAVKRPNDIRMEVNLDLPEEWTQDLDNNGTMDGLENGGFTVTKAELVITHDITNNPNDQVRPEDYENEAAIGRLPSHYIVQDPDDPSNTLWVSPVDTYAGDSTFLPSYFKLTETGEIDLGAGGIAVYDLADNLVGYRNVDGDNNPIGTVLRDFSLATAGTTEDLDFITEDLELGFTPAWFTTTDREPFEWSYDLYPDDPNANVFVSFRSPQDSEEFNDDTLVSGPRWRLTPNKFGQDLPGLEVPLEENSQPPFTRSNIKYETGTLTTTTLNLLDWEGDSPLSNSIGWMAVDKETLDENGDGLIDDGWSNVNGSLGAGDDVPDGLVLSAVTPNGVTLESEFLDTALYVKGDRQDTANLYDIELVLTYTGGNDTGTEQNIGTVQNVSDLNHEARTVTFEDGASFDNAVVFATVSTYRGADPITVEFSEVTSTSATLYLEEPDAYDGFHLFEDVTLVAFEEGAWTLPDGSLLQVGETVFQAGATDEFQSVAFDVAFESEPVILVQVQTNNGAQWEIVRTQNITTTGFEFAIEEAENADGFHVSEVVGWAAVDATSSDGVVDWGDVTAQAFNTGTTVDHTPDAFEFLEDVGTDPLVSAIMASYNGPDTANLRMTGLTDDGTTASTNFLIQEERTLDTEITHLLEEVNGLAFSESGVLTGTEYLAIA